MRYKAFKIALTILLAGCSGSSGGGGASSPTSHNAAECPSIFGKFQLLSDPGVISEVGRNAAGETVLVFDSSNPLTVNGKEQLDSEGRTKVTATCSLGAIKFQGSDDGVEQLGTLRTKGEGFVIEMQKPEAMTMEYIPLSKKGETKVNSVEKLEQSLLPDLVTQISFKVKTERVRQHGASFNFSEGRYIGSETVSDGAYCGFVSTDRNVNGYRLEARTYSAKTLSDRHTGWTWLIFASATQGDGLVDYFACVLKKDREYIRDLTLAEARKVVGDEVEIEVIAK
jgi:hypothetical protein